MEKKYVEITSNEVRDRCSANSKIICVIPKGTRFYRVQLAEFDEPLHFNSKLNHRYADPFFRIGVAYFGLSAETALLERMQGLLSQGEVNLWVVYELELSQDLPVIDVPVLNRSSHNSLSSIVAPKGDGRKGYGPTQALSGAIIGAKIPGVGGILYLSQAGCSASLDAGNGKCLALFEGADKSLFKTLSRTPLGMYSLSDVENACEFLQDNELLST